MQERDRLAIGYDKSMGEHRDEWLFWLGVATVGFGVFVVIAFFWRLFA
jgi:hypothetical protein